MTQRSWESIHQVEDDYWIAYDRHRRRNKKISICGAVILLGVAVITIYYLQV